MAAYNKTHAYARLYASLNNVDIGDLSVTVIATRHPRNLLAFVKKQFNVQNVQPGIYTVDGEVYPTQMIVTSELSRNDNFWLAHLRNDLTVEQLTQVITAADKPETDAYMHAITDANPETLEELYMRRKKGVIYTEKLDAFLREKFAPYYASEIARCVAKGVAEGKAEGKAESVLTILRARFAKVPKRVERSIRQISDPIALDSWTAQAATCQTIDEFITALN